MYFLLNWVMGFEFKKFFRNDNGADTTKKNFFSVNLGMFLFSSQCGFIALNNWKHYSNTCFLESTYWSKFSLYTKLSLPNNSTQVTDGIQFLSSTGSWVLQFNYSNNLSDTRAQLFTILSNQLFYISSVSVVYPSCVWLERELSDFSNINFLGLQDTRRLLLDYFEDKQQWQTHKLIDKNFNASLYDINLSY